MENQELKIHVMKIETHSLIILSKKDHFSLPELKDEIGMIYNPASKPPTMTFGFKAFDFFFDCDETINAYDLLFEALLDADIDLDAREMNISSYHVVDAGDYLTECFNLHCSHRADVQAA